jgi:hypothetical protein
MSAKPMITEDIKRRLEELRLKAEEARVYAESMSDPGCRAALSGMAASYDAMAISLENSIETRPNRWTKHDGEKAGRSA